VHVLCSPLALLCLPRSCSVLGRQCSFETGRETGQKSGPTDPIGAKIIVYLKSSIHNRGRISTKIQLNLNLHPKARRIKSDAETGAQKCLLCMDHAQELVACSLDVCLVLGVRKY
jgi:hypothetical protein